MGIPSYFSYIVKNHFHIIQKFISNTFHVDNFYLDCNSIIYDSVYKLNAENIDNPISSKMIIQSVIHKIEEYIHLIQPSKNIFIAFDGVAPVAKLEQQRERRYKSWYQAQVTKQIFKKTTSADAWNTSEITPGTPFMNELNKGITSYFNNNIKYKNNNVIVSTTDDCGEGEHKIFEYIRDYPIEHIDTTTVIYGLDADLIMLSINHLPIHNKIYLFRETPHFIKSINIELEPNENYLLDIPELAKIITLNMNNGEQLNTQQKHNRIYDYIFMCFFLGNDFMPHFPSINIRTGGVDKMINAYKETIGNTNENLTDGKKIYWKNVRKLVSFLAENEEDYFKAEMKLRDRREKIFYPNDTPENTYKRFDALPNIERAMEKYIQPYKDGWEKRYYKCLFEIDNSNEETVSKVCYNYLQGLEWNMKYYTSGCPDWRWCYNYSYPPLLCDLIKVIPYFDREFVSYQDKKPVLPLVQLCYVLPHSSLYLIPSKLRENLEKKKSKWYNNDCEFIWAFCKYFWESHVVLPDIDIDELIQFVEQNK